MSSTVAIDANTPLSYSIHPSIAIEPFDKTTRRVTPATSTISKKSYDQFGVSSLWQNLQFYASDQAKTRNFSQFS